MNLRQSIELGVRCSASPSPDSEEILKHPEEVERIFREANDRRIQWFNDALKFWNGEVCRHNDTEACIFRSGLMDIMGQRAEAARFNQQ